MILNGSGSKYCSHDVLHFLVDVGNTRIKAAPVSADGSIGILSAVPVSDSPAEFDDQFEGFVTSLPGAAFALASGQVELLISDPANRLTKAVEAFSQRHSCPVEHMDTAKLPGRILTRNPERLGTDRLAAALGAFRRFGSQAAVIDMGTALCVDLVTADGAYAGGIVCPGIDLSYRALHEQTGLPLPLFSSPSMNAAMPITTEEALSRGGRIAVPSLIDGLIRHVRSFAGNDLPVILTGGGCMPFLDLLPEDLPYDPELNLRGMAEYIRLTTGAFS
ncbi:type III pantothenate kinase [Streptomyces mirabilis]|uniref:type III pantothenate kinase n=1 Tax=Streptomyces mirabilis TaxID=68239 RepID=UPI00380AC29D